MAVNDAAELETECIESLEEPPRYKVIMYNDDVTTMDFVEEILRRIFNKHPQHAHAIMMSVHHNGSGLAGIYTHEIAEAKVNQVHQEARKAGYPLKCGLEKE